MQVDPYQLNNLYQSEQGTLARAADEVLNNDLPVSSFNVSAISAKAATSMRPQTLRCRLLSRLDGLLMLLKTCSGRQCTHPWHTLFPDGAVRSLTDALDERHDDFFNKQMPAVSFDKCEKGFIIESEGPTWTDSQIYGMVHEISLEV